MAGLLLTTQLSLTEYRVLAASSTAVQGELIQGGQGKAQTILDDGSNDQEIDIRISSLEEDTDAFRDDDSNLIAIDSLLSEGEDVDWNEDTLVLTEEGLASPTFKIHGPYRDTHDRALRNGPMAYGHTAETCAKACPTYKYFALQNNGWCCCDNDFTHVTKYGKADCGATGGGWCNYVYEQDVILP